jgi:hypothetical protein
MVGEAVPGDRSADHEGADDAPTPPSGLPLGRQSSVDPAAETPPSGIGLADLVRSEDVPTGGPAVLGGEDPVTPEPGADAGAWPTLEYRRQEREQGQRGRFGWGRRRGSE